MRQVCNCYLVLLALFFLLGVPLAADWLMPPAPKYQATELAGRAPSDSVTVLAWAFQGQVDFDRLAADLAAAVPEAGKAIEGKIEQDFGYSPSQILEFFTGNGYFAAGGAFFQGGEFRYGLGLELARPEAFEAWLTRLLEDSPVGPYQHRGFRVRATGPHEPLLAVGRDWFLVGKDQEELDLHIDALEGRNRLSGQKGYSGAVQSLGVAQSGLCLYLDGEAVRKALSEEAESPSESPGSEALGLWNYAILTVDFPSRETNGLLGLHQVDNALSRALRQRGGINTDTLKLLPENLSTLAAVDLAWGLGVLEAAGESFPELRERLEMMTTGPEALGDPREAFSGPTVFATDFLDRVGPRMVKDFIGKRGDVMECRSNLEDLRIQLSYYNGPPEDAWKELAEDLPTCPAAGEPTYRYRERDELPEIYCSGSHHLGLAADNPRIGYGYVSQADLSEELGGKGEPNMLAITRVRNPKLAHHFLNSIEQPVAKPSPKLTVCKMNLKQLGTAMEMYSTDWSGKYPRDFTMLTPNYLKTIPHCPAAGKDTYSASLQTGPDAPENEPAYEDYYYFECQGQNHRETLANYPRYSAIVGLDTGPELEIPKPARLELPIDPDGLRVYGSDGEGVLLMDPARMLAIVARGPSARALAEKKRTEPLPKEIVEALKWGDDGLVYLGYSNLQVLYDYVEGTLDSMLPPEEEARSFLDVARVMRKLAGDLQDVQAIESVPEGLRYRGRGYAGTPVFGSTLMVGAAITVPNFVRARESGRLTACKSNLKNIGTGLEMYSTDWDGTYPESLGKLTPDYLRRIPDCPAAGRDTYSESYSRQGDPDEPLSYGYEVYCQGHFHEGVNVPENYPRYNGIEGLIER